MEFDLDIGRTGLAILVLLFLLLSVEDLYIWIIDGVVPGLEFFVAVVLVLVVFFFAIRTARHHPPP